jgi:hypothetical protein
MSFLSKVVTRRRLVLVCARLVVQGVVTCACPQTGLGAFELTCVQAASGAKLQAMLRHERNLVGPGPSLMWPRQARSRRRAY